MSGGDDDGLCAAAAHDEKVSAVMAAAASEIKRTRNGANGGEEIQIEDKKENIYGERGEDERKKEEKAKVPQEALTHSVFFFFSFSVEHQRNTLRPSRLHGKKVN